MTMKRYLRDDRSEDQKESHSVLVGGYDKFLSGWRCWDGTDRQDSYAFWACQPENKEVVEAWVTARPEFRNVKQRRYEWCYEKAKSADVHIYLVDEGHRYLEPK